jgi:hypothetical protein
MTEMGRLVVVVCRQTFFSLFIDDLYDSFVSANVSLMCLFGPASCVCVCVDVRTTVMTYVNISFPNPLLTVTN